MAAPLSSNRRRHLPGRNTDGPHPAPEPLPAAVFGFRRSGADWPLGRRGTVLAPQPEGLPEGRSCDRRRVRDERDAGAPDRIGVVAELSPTLLADRQRAL